MMSQHFCLNSELSGAIAKRLPHAKNQLSVTGSFFNQFVTNIYIHNIRVLQEIPKFESYDAHSSNSLLSSPSVHHKIFMQFGDGLVVAQDILPLVLIYNGICPA